MGAEALQPAVVLVPFPAQGHVTPMLHLARALAAHGLAPTVAVPDFIHRRIVGPDADGGGGVALASIPSGIPDGGRGDPPGFAAIAHAMEHHMPAHLERILARARAATGCQVSCLVVDVLASWAVPVAARCGVPAAGFWPAMLASYRIVAAIPELLDKGLISESAQFATSRISQKLTSLPRQSTRDRFLPSSPMARYGKICSTLVCTSRGGAPILSNQSDNEVGQDQMIRGLQILPAQVELSTKELPWLVGDSVTRKSRFAFWLQTLHRARCFRSVLVNSFPGEAGSVAAQDGHPARQAPRILPVGPLLAGGGNVERTKGRDGAVAPNLQQSPCKNPSMWQADSTCIGWLDRQRAASVVYVSFGSWVGPIGPEKIRELALGLEATGRPFLWALKKDPSWRAGLPDSYAERVAGRGKVVDWAPQEDVLGHKSVGCYLTHCGWNSTVEAIQHGVRLLCYPVLGDQFINCAYITMLWEVGLKLGSMSKNDVKDCIERIMEGEEGRHLQEKMSGLRKRVVTADARCLAQLNVKSFVNEIKRDYPLLMQIYDIL